VPSVRLENQEWFEWQTTDGNTARLQWQGCVCMATDGHGKYTVRVLTICILPSHPLGKVEGAYHHHGLASYRCAWCSCTLELYILQNISPCYYLQVQFTYVEELYTKRNRTAHACANSQCVPLWFFRVPGNEAKEGSTRIHLRLWA